MARIGAPLNPRGEQQPRYKKARAQGLSSPRAPFRIHLYALSVHFSETLRCSTLVSDSSSLRLRSLPCLLAREK